MLEPNKTALVIVDLQEGVPFHYTPHSYQKVVKNTAKLAKKFSEINAFIVCLKVPVSKKVGNLHPNIDIAPDASKLALMLEEREKISDLLVPELENIQNKHVIERQQWGGFYATDLDAQLRRRGIDTIVLCGVATGYGVDTTAREAYQHNYQQVFAEDAMGSLSEQEHMWGCNNIFPKIGKVRETEQIINSFTL